MGKRFTPKLLARFAREHRGEGTYVDFVPYHKVARGDPSSSGRSNLLMFRDRLRESLSDGELVEQYFASTLPNLDDCVEQYKLTHEPSPHPLAAYGDRDEVTLFPGTLQLAEELRIKHPRVYGEGGSALWTMTTDLVPIFKVGASPRELLAVSFKPPGWRSRKRTVERLRLEREYWLRRSVRWLLITPAQYDIRVDRTVRRTAAWVFADEASADQRAIATQIGHHFNGFPLQVVLSEIERELGAMDVAQRAFWQAAWNAELPLDLTNGWRPHLPIVVLGPQAFWAQNPIASQRSAWLSN